MVKKLLIANRGEIAIRVARSAAEMGIATVAVYSEDDAQSLHARRADEALALAGIGAGAYLDAAQIIALAQSCAADAIHPGYGFLSEDSAFAAACEAAGLIFIGPTPETLALLGDKVRARLLAQHCDIPILEGGPVGSPAEAAAFLESLGAGGAMMIKAAGGGGGRGMRVLKHGDDVGAAFERCQAEAKGAFGRGELYVERFFPHARHIEVQIVGDGAGAVTHLWDRDCSLQRQRQKIVEIAPALALAAKTRAALLAAAVKLGQACAYRGAGTVEFLVAGEDFAFMEANARLQVEHTVTEEVTGLDLVRLQIAIAEKRPLSKLGVAKPPAVQGVAIQARVNLETMTAEGAAKPAGGVLTVYEPPSGPGVRVDGYGYSGYRTSVRFDPLLAKVIVHVRDGNLPMAAAKARRALEEFRIEGAANNISFLRALLAHPDVIAGKADTRFVEDHAGQFLAAAPIAPPTLERRAGVKVDAADPLAVLAHGRNAEGAPASSASFAAARAGEDIIGPDGAFALRAPLQGTVIEIAAGIGELVREGQPLIIMEAMKMQHVVPAPMSGVVRMLTVSPGDAVFEDHPLAFIEAADSPGAAIGGETGVNLDDIRPDLEELFKRRALTKDEARPDAVERRRKTGQRTARENIEDLCDPDSFTEYAPLVVAGRLRRQSMDELIARTPADGLVMGLGRVNGAHFDDEHARVVAMSYDYTVLAGTQGLRNHQKKDRLLNIAEKWRLPIVFFTEGGGGRPGDTDAISAGGLTVTTFQMYARLSGLAPLVGINSGYCFAGNAALLGCCDVIIATKNSSIGMGGPAMIEGGGLGVFHPKDVGPVSVMAPNGVIDVVVEDEPEGVAVAKKYLSYFQGVLLDWSCADQRLLRHAIPENRLRVYDVRVVIETMCDVGSVLELRRAFGVGMVTALARIEGRPIGIIANNPMHLGGAIDRDGSDKAARFMQLCDAFDIPILMLCDTPGNMVGPEAEKTALVRHNSRLFLIGANVSVPLFTVILRKGYGLGAQGMAGASFFAPFFTISWPTGEFGGMGLEGAVKLGYRNELAAIKDPAARKAKFDQMVAASYQRGKALSAATLFEFDDVIDPADTRKWIMAGLRAVPPPPKREGKKRPWIDAW